ncbi:MAG: hypothetical protein GX661_00715 [Acholeplasmataceae bacterium]|nr:hypothetical protein [Acholeplasmataceae bacterium]
MDVSLIISLVAAAAGVAAVIVAAIALTSSNSVARTQIFLDLRKAHNEVQSKMDDRYHDNEWNPLENEVGRKSIEKYWLHTLSEWYATKKLNKGKFDDLWHEYYVPAIASGLRNKPIRIVLWNMLYGKPGSTFSGFRKEFGQTIEEIYRATYHKELKDDC